MRSVPTFPSQTTTPDPTLPFHSKRCPIVEMLDRASLQYVAPNFLYLKTTGEAWEEEAETRRQGQIPLQWQRSW